MPRGKLKVALAPTPFAEPIEELPATVETLAVNKSMTRMRWLSESVMKSLQPRIARPLGAENWALLPTPSAAPVVAHKPANEETMPVEKSKARRQ
jgi:hypothetical protein